MKFHFLYETVSLPCAVLQATKNTQKAVIAAGHELALDYDALVINLPLVAWKKTFFKPILASLKAVFTGKRRIIMLHEWADLHPLRKAFITPILWLSSTILFSSPLVRAGYTAQNAPLFPVPANIKRPDVAKNPAKKLTIGHFGSIYPSKNSIKLLEIAGELKARNIDFELLFIGEFVKASDTLEADFHAEMARLNITENVRITGYIASLDDLFALFETVSVFIYPFTEGLTARRSSVLAVSQTGRPIITTPAQRSDEFNHHRDYQSIIASGLLHFSDDYGGKTLELHNAASNPYDYDIPRAWNEVAQSLITAAK
jgi:glycosyltransferase involved in cell wall biosynthesis